MRGNVSFVNIYDERVAVQSIVYLFSGSSKKVNTSNAIVRHVKGDVQGWKLDMQGPCIRCRAQPHYSPCDVT